MPICAQYNSFVDTSACVEPTTRPCCNCTVDGNTCGTNRFTADPDICCTVDDPTYATDETIDEIIVDAESGSVQILVSTSAAIASLILF